MTWAQAQATGVAYSTWIARYDPGDDDSAAGSAGVREPRRPIQPNYSAGAALVLPASADPEGLEEAIQRGRALAIKYGW